MTRAEYDVVVVGAGLGGLTAAAILAAAGLEVLVLDRGEGPGGLAHAFRRGPYVFDPAVHVLAHAQDGRTVDLLLRQLGVHDRCEFLALPHTYGVRIGAAGLDVPAGIEAGIAAHGPALRPFLETTIRFFGEASHLAMQTSLQELEAALPRFPTFFAYRNATVADVLSEHVSNPHDAALAAATWPYFGLPPSRLSYLAFAKILSCMLEGPSYCRGSFQALADALAHAVEMRGGKIVTGTTVSRILIEGGAVAGVLAPQGEIRARAVVSNADGRHTYEELVGEEHLPPAFLRRLRRLEPTLSAFVLFVATRLDVAAAGIASETLLFEGDDHEQAFENARAGRPDGVWVAVPTLTDTSLAPAGEHLVIATSLAPFEHEWERVQDEFADALLALVERMLLPGLRAEATHVEIATPVALARHTGAYRGAAYGPAPTPAQTGNRRLGHDSPVPGLFLTGQWTHEGSGALPVIISGFRTARLVLERAGLGDRAPVLQAPDMPLPV